MSQDGQKIWTVYHPEKTFSIRIGKNKAVVCFSSQDKATSFIEASDLGGGTTTLEMPGDFFVAWLRQNYKAGRTFIYKDPASVDTARNPTPIGRVLLAVE